MSKIHSANPNPCKDCPWRTSNQGKPHPGHWYTKANLVRLWAGLRRGESMSCHPTDPTNPLPPGFEPPPDGVETHECTGGLVIQQREFMLLQNDFKGNLKAYRAARPGGLTREGVLDIVQRVTLSGAVAAMFGSKPAMTKPNLNDEDVSHPKLSWTPKTK